MENLFGEFPLAIIFQKEEMNRLEDIKLKSVWGDRLYRILLKSKQQTDKGKWVIELVQGV